jgi:hypothetical protein
MLLQSKHRSISNCNCLASTTTTENTRALRIVYNPHTKAALDILEGSMESLHHGTETERCEGVTEYVLCYAMGTENKTQSEVSRFVPVNTHTGFQNSCFLYALIKNLSIELSLH